jgi:hypothetical protein
VATVFAASAQETPASYGSAAIGTSDFTSYLHFQARQPLCLLGIGRSEQESMEAAFKN